MDIPKEKLERALKQGWKRRNVELLLAYYGDDYDTFYGEPADIDHDKAIDCLMYEHRGEDDPTPEQLVREAMLDDLFIREGGVPGVVREYLDSLPEDKWDWGYIMEMMNNHYTIRGKFILIPW